MISTRRILNFCLAVFLLASCGTPQVVRYPQDGQARTFDTSLPHFDVKASVVWSDAAPVLQLTSTLPYERISFALVESGRYEAYLEVQTQVRSTASGQAVHTGVRTDTVKVARYAGTQALDVHRLTEMVSLVEGTYVASVTLTDRLSGASVQRQLPVTIPSATATLYLGPLRLEESAGDRTQPVASLHVSEVYAESLQVQTTLRVDREEATSWALVLEQLPADTTIADEPFWPSLTNRDGTFRGVSFGEPDTLQRSERLLDADAGVVDVRVTLPPLDPGVYRLRASFTAYESEVSRLFIIQSPFFPRLATLDDMVAAALYLARPDEQKVLRSALGTPKAKAALDAFWQALFEEAGKAATVLEAYYTRAEEANRRYTTHKAGWKTDRGMVYMILGPPLFVDDRIDRLRWQYASNSAEGAQTLTFQRVRSRDPVSGVPFEDYVLLRDPRYEVQWRRAIQRWRLGRIQ